MKKICAIGLTVFVCSGSAAAQSLDDAAVDSAIRVGQAKKYGHLTSSCSADAGFGANLAANMAGGLQHNGSYNVVFSLAPGRIAFMAAEAKRLYKPFSASDVPEEVRSGGLAYVTAVPDSPTRSGNSGAVAVAAPLERIVLKSKANPNAFVQPKDLEMSPVEWSNLLGGKVSGTIGVATFPIDQIREMPAGEFDVVLITTAGERRCKVGMKDRQRVLGPR